MLERVPATAESAALVFLRSLEKPSRSTRTLDPRFWRNGSDNIGRSSWWPTYLQKIRQVPQTSNTSYNESLVNPEFCSLLRKPSRKPVAGGGNTYPRRYTVSAPSQQHETDTKQDVYHVFGLNTIHDHDIGPREEFTKAQSVTSHSDLHLSKDLPRLQSDGREPADETFASPGFVPHRRRRDADLQRGGNQGSDRKSDAVLIETQPASEEPFVSPFFPPYPPAEEKPLPDVPNKAAQSIRAFPALVSNRLAKRRQHIRNTERLLAREDLTLKQWKATLKRQSIMREQRVSLDDREQQEFLELLKFGSDATNEQIDQAWRAFTALQDQELHAIAIFDFLTKSRTPKHFARAREAFRLIPRTSRTRSAYEAAIAIELQRSRYMEALTLAFDAATINIDVLSDLFAHCVEKSLWNTAAEMIYRNRTARTRMQSTATSQDPVRREQMVPVEQLTSKCRNIPELYEQVMSLTDRLRAGDPVLFEHRDILITLRDDLAVACTRSSIVMSRISQSNLQTLLALGVNVPMKATMHRYALITLQNLPNRGDRAGFALRIYRSFRFRLPEQPVETWMVTGLIATCGAAGHPVSIYDYLLDEFSRHFGPPDAAALQQVLVNCARQGDLDAVRHHFEKHVQGRFHELSAKPRVVFLSAFIYACAVTGDITNARKQFEMIRQDYDIVPNTTCWNMLLLAHVKSNDDLSAFDVFEEMQQAEVAPNSHTYGTLLAACKAHADSEMALELLNDARDQGLHISVPMIDTVVGTYLAQDDVQSAWRFAKATTQSKPSESLTRLWNSFLYYFASKRNTAGLISTQKMMAQHNIPSDSMTYAARMLAFALSGKTDEAAKLLHKMSSRGLLTTHVHYFVVLQGYVREGNRDMVATIFNEIKQVFPHVLPRGKTAMRRLQSGLGDRSGDHDLAARDITAFLATSLEGLHVTGGANEGASPGRQRQATSIALMYFENAVRSLIQHKHHDMARTLLEHFEATLKKKSKGHALSADYDMRLLLLKMDVSFAQADDAGVETIWHELLQLALKQQQPIQTLRQERRISTNDVNAGDAKETGPATAKVNKKYSFVVEKALDHYIEAMSRAQRHGHLIKSMRDFQHAGLVLTGRNLNRYVQALCCSTYINDRVKAFAIAQRQMLNFAQSWTLLARGLLRRQKTVYVFEKVYKHAPRPVLRKRKTYSTIKRKEAMQLDPRRHIPTYTTMVNLAAVLSRAGTKAANGKPEELRKITRSADRLKTFLERMPYLKDYVQGTLLRGRDRTGDPEPRPRAEESFRQRAAIGSVLQAQASSSAVAENITISSPNSRRELPEGSLGEISRTPIVLAGKGRLETETEMRRRIARQERDQEHFKALKITPDLQGRSGDSTLAQEDLGSVEWMSIPVAQDFTGTDSGRAQGNASEASFLPLPQIDISKRGQHEPRSQMELKPDIAPKATLTSQEDTVRRGFKRPSTDYGLASSEGPAQTSENPPTQTVQQQLELLESRRAEGRAKLVAREKPATSGLAIRYVALRRRRHIIARQQRHEAHKVMSKLRKQNVVSPRATKPRTAANRRILASIRANKRRKAYLAEEANNRQGKRLPPLPQTEGALRRRRRIKGQVTVRPVADLNRRKSQYLIRRGVLPETRKPEITAGSDRARYTAHTPRGYLLLPRLSQRKNEHTFRKLSGKLLKPSMLLVRTRAPGTTSSRRRTLRARLSKAREHLQVQTARRIGPELYQKKLEEERAKPQFVPYR